jgi:YHS domain-containing protein
MFKDPVCNMMVDEKTAEYVSEIDGARNYFCSATCKSEFEEHEKDYEKKSNRSNCSCCC